MPVPADGGAFWQRRLKGFHQGLGIAQPLQHGLDRWGWQRRASVIGLRGLGGHADAAVSEHEAIYRAIRDGDPEAAAQATSVHLDNTLEDYRREIQRRVFG
ncbi:MAG TPA: FCD domain-containing protein [Streptosporangiaceae bacterium]|nr:FCD domain-containing protein [Streptosporangiaceae bacterium]